MQGEREGIRGMYGWVDGLMDDLMKGGRGESESEIER